MGNRVTKLLDSFGLVPSQEQCVQMGVVLSFMFLVRLTRWSVQTYQTNDFDVEVAYDPSDPAYQAMLEKCKFCQIITNEKSLSYMDDTCAIFGDIRPVAQ